MQKIDFNSVDFVGFEDKEDILLDTGVILAFLNSYDSWHSTVLKLFNNYVLNNDNAIFLYINPTLINEVTFLSGKPMEQYSKAKGLTFTESDYKEAKDKTILGLKRLIEDEIIIVLEGNKNSILKQLSIFEKLGDADAVYASVANEYGTSFLTVDNRLVNNIISIKEELANINNIYYTLPAYKTY